MSEETTFSFPPKGHAAILAYDSANDRWQAVYVDASGNLQVDIAAAEQLECLAHQYDGSAWRKSNLLWGYNAIWDEDLGGDATEANYSGVSSTIPAGELWILQGASVRNPIRGVTLAFIYIDRASGAQVYLNFAATMAQYEPLLATGQFVLRAGDVVRVFVGGCTVGDSIDAGVVGYKMKVNM